MSADAPKPSRLKIRFMPGPAAPPDDDPLMAAVNPRPSWYLEATEAGGQEVGRWEIWHPLDLMSEETAQLMAIERELEQATSEQYLARIKSQVQLLTPGLPDAIYQRLSGHQLFAIGVKAWRRPSETPKDTKDRKEDAVNPPDGERGSGSSSPAVLAASDGATRT